MKEPTINTMLQKLAWMESVAPILDLNPATKKLTERIIRKTVKSQYIPDPTLVNSGLAQSANDNKDNIVNQEVL